MGGVWDGPAHLSLVGLEKSTEWEKNTEWEKSVDVVVLVSLLLKRNGSGVGWLLISLLLG